MTHMRDRGAVQPDCTDLPRNRLCSKTLKFELASSPQPRNSQMCRTLWCTHVCMELHVHGGQPVINKGFLFVTLGLCQWEVSVECSCAAHGACRLRLVMCSATWQSLCPRDDFLPFKDINMVFCSPVLSLKSVCP